VIRIRAITRPARRVIAACALGAVAAMLPAVPAAAHSGETAAATHYRSRLVDTSPSTTSAELRLVGHGTHVEMIRRTAREVVAIGYLGEPYLRITSDGVFANAASPTAYTNGTLEPEDAPGGVRPVPSPGPDSLSKAAQQPPTAVTWRRIGSGNSARWHDHRTHWIATALPPAAAANPAVGHRIANWQLKIVADGQQVTARGTLDYLPPPVPSVWWASVLLLAGAVALAGQWRRPVPILGGLLLAAAVVALAEGAARAADAGERAWGVPAALVTGDTYATITALGAVAAAYVAFRNRPVAPFAVALGAVCLAVLAGVTRADVFSYGGVPAAWPALYSRLAVATVTGLGAGIAVAGWLRIKAQPSHPDNAPSHNSDVRV
jgi:hypothetical protein